MVEWNDTYEPQFVNKKRASGDRSSALRLQETGYQFPVHWRSHNLRPFVAWDGEGITYPTHVEQSYVLFGASTGDRISKPSLGTTDCFDLLLAVERSTPDAIHVGFGLQYDCNMFFRDLERRHLEYIYRHHKCRWEGYRIEYRPGKWLSIRKGDTRVRLFDVFGFFQTSFVKACERFLGRDDPELEQIREGKRARQSFTYDQLDTFIVPYWQGELRLLVRLMNALRHDLDEAGLPIVSWHGPGAVANTVFRQHHIQQAKSDTVPQEVNRAAQYAYAGGRFELFRCGHHPNTVWQYDLNSAYPAAIARLPNLRDGTWATVEAGEVEPDSFGVYRVQYDAAHHPRRLFTAPQPLYVRDAHGNVSYPPIADGWYWTPEALLIDSRFVKGGYVFRHDGSMPFEFVHDMYETRLEWKQNGNSAERALKLALNSLYGKMAQRSGWLQEGDPIPRWHQLEWAGFVTSATRASLWEDAISKASDSLIAVETDAIFTTECLPTLAKSSAMGEWTETKYDWITYLQNGLYFASQEGELVSRYRGFDDGSLSHSDVMAYLSDVGRQASEPLYGRTTRFIGLGLGLHTRLPWRSWQSEYRAVKLGGGGKRAHVPGLCPPCRAGIPPSECLHPLTIITPGGRSEPHSLPWLAGAESELRRIDELERW